MPTPLPCDIALANAIVSELNTRWGAQFTAERTWVPDWDEKTELDVLRVAVNPSPDPTGELLPGRDELREDWPMDLVFAVRLAARSRGEIDALITLVDAVREFLQLQTFTLDDGREFTGLGFDFHARFDPTLLQRQKVGADVRYVGNFLSAFRVPFLRLA